MQKRDGYTIDDIYALPDGERMELLDGVLYLMDMPGTTHQRIRGELQQAIANFIDGHGLPYESLGAPFAVFIAGDDKNLWSRT